VFREQLEEERKRSGIRSDSDVEADESDMDDDDMLEEENEERVKKGWEPIQNLKSSAGKEGSHEAANESDPDKNSENTAENTENSTNIFGGNSSNNNDDFFNNKEQKPVGNINDSFSIIADVLPADISRNIANAASAAQNSTMNTASMSSSNEYFLKQMQAVGEEYRAASVGSVVGTLESVQEDNYQEENQIGQEEEQDSEEDSDDNEDNEGQVPETLMPSEGMHTSEANAMAGRNLADELDDKRAARARRKEAKEEHKMKKMERKLEIHSLVGATAGVGAKLKDKLAAMRGGNALMAANVVQKPTFLSRLFQVTSRTMFDHLHPKKDRVETALGTGEWLESEGYSGKKEGEEGGPKQVLAIDEEADEGYNIFCILGRSRGRRAVRSRFSL